MPRRANPWVEDVYEMLGQRAMLSSEIADRLKPHHRYSPTPRRVTFVLRGDSRFKEIGNVIVGTLSRSRSHPVKLIGRKDLKYEDTHPYAVVRGEYNE